MQAQVEHNFMLMQLVEFWLREDQDRMLSKAECSENQLLMQVIDQYRARKLFI
jgi:phosphoribosylformylglycinamidine (FGAM) synthase-like enzyme